MTGERATRRKLALRKFLESQPDSFFEELNEEVILDRDLGNVDEPAQLNVDSRVLVEEYLESDSTRRKGDYVS